MLAGLAIGASAYAAKFAIEAAVKLRSASGPNLRQFYKVKLCMTASCLLLLHKFWANQASTLGQDLVSGKSLLLVLESIALQGGFQQTMNRREAALILGIREHAKEDIVKDAHRKIMIANHPDAGRFCINTKDCKCSLLGRNTSLRYATITYRRIFPIRWSTLSSRDLLS